MEEENRKFKSQEKLLDSFYEDVQKFLDSGDSHMQCTICSELFIQATTISCGHTFCEYCIETWKAQKENCPICRQNILSQMPNKVLDMFLSAFIDKFLPAKFAEIRINLITERKRNRGNSTPGNRTISWFPT